MYLMDKGTRYTHPSDWKKKEPGIWILEHEVKIKGKWCNVTTTCLGTLQCEVCGMPIADDGSSKCNSCNHAIARCARGAAGALWKKLIENWTRRKAWEEDLAKRTIVTPVPLKELIERFEEVE